MLKLFDLLLPDDITALAMGACFAVLQVTVIGACIALQPLPQATGVSPPTPCGVISPPPTRTLIPSAEVASAGGKAE